MTDPSVADDLFAERMTYPDPEAKDRLARLIGIDDAKERLAKILGVLVNPVRLRQWAKAHHPQATAIVDLTLKRPPLVVLAGDVGSGKTELASTIGDMVSRQEKIEITLLSLSLATRGQGRVGEMTQLLSSAFNYTWDEARKISSPGQASRGAVILLVDEADAIAQSREAAQMHHEDRAGVNAFIKGVDRLSNGSVPAVVIMCTNRLEALDPAVRRRAADVIIFGRPDKLKRKALLHPYFHSLGFSESITDAIVEATGENNNRPYSFTYSDLMQRLLPSITLGSYPHGPIKETTALDIARSMIPTPPFRENVG
jgi:AAA+ superfamily predicted ATPase